MTIPEPAFGYDEAWHRLVGFIQAVSEREDDKLGLVADIVNYIEQLEDDRIRPIQQYIDSITHYCE